MRAGTSLGARFLGPFLYCTMGALFRIAPLRPWSLKVGFLSEYAGILLPAPRGTRVQAQQFETFRGELVIGPGVTPADRVVLYFHGGGFFACGLRTHRRLVARISAAAGMPVLSIAYRQLPRHTLTHALEDCLTAYRSLLARGYSEVTFAGDSAGGYLAIEAARLVIQEGLPSPRSIVALSPWVDLFGHIERHPRQARRDAYVPARKLASLGSFAVGADARQRPLLDADLTMLPPVLIHVGSAEILRTDAELLAQRLEAADVPVDLQVWHRQVHVFQAFADVVAEGRLAIEEIGVFIQNSSMRRAHEGAA